MPHFASSTDVAHNLQLMTRGHRLGYLSKAHSSSPKQKIKSG